MGVDPNNEKEAAELIDRGKRERVIPEAVMECIKDGKEWYKIHFNNEVDRLGKTEKVDDLLKLINVITAMMSVNPQISAAIDWYNLLADVCDALGLKHNIISEKDFEAQIAAQAEQQAQLMQAQTGQLQAASNRDNATALKDLGNEQQY
jgi:hypothetical protein